MTWPANQAAPHQAARPAGSPDPAARIAARLTSCSPRSSVLIFGECDLQHAKLKPSAAWTPRRTGREPEAVSAGAELDVVAARRRWGHASSIALAVVLAFVFGYALTMTPVLRSGVALRVAIGIAFAADTISIATMEVVDNAFLLAVPGALDAQLTDGLFWVSLVVSLIVAFVVTVPVNRALIARGKGHAVVHAHHN